MEFGFICERALYSTEHVTIKPLPDIDEKYKIIKDNLFIEEGWIYPPVKIDSNGKPTKSMSFYRLPNSHVLSINISESDALDNLSDFIITFFGFLKGMQLKPNGHGHFYKTPINQAKLVGFIIDDNDFNHILDMAINFFINHREIAHIFHAVVFLFLFGQSYSHGFEKFDAQYRVMDGCYNISKKLYGIQARNHAHRIIKMCNEFNIPIPNWAKMLDGKSFLSQLRNELVHEATFAGDRIGYNLPAENYYFGFPRVNEKLILSIIGVKSEILTRNIDRTQYVVRLDK